MGKHYPRAPVSNWCVFWYNVGNESHSITRRNAGRRKDNDPRSHSRNETERYIDDFNVPFFYINGHATINNEAENVT